MSTLLRTRRMPAKYRLGKNGLTEIVYNTMPETFIVLPGTRWLEQRREREAREAALLEEVVRAAAEQIGVVPSPTIDTEIEPGTEEVAAPEASFATEAAVEIAPEPEIVPSFTYTPEENVVDESLSWTERMQIASTKLVRRQVAAH